MNANNNNASIHTYHIIQQFFFLLLLLRRFLHFHAIINSLARVSFSKKKQFFLFKISKTGKCFFCRAKNALCGIMRLLNGKDLAKKCVYVYAFQSKISMKFYRYLDFNFFFLLSSSSFLSLFFKQNFVASTMKTWLKTFFFFARITKTKEICIFRVEERENKKKKRCVLLKFKSKRGRNQGKNEF